MLINRIISGTIAGVCLALAGGVVSAVELGPVMQEIVARAEQGQAQAQYELAMSYQRGQEVVQDYAQALQWLEKAASQHYVEAQLQLGMMYFKGQGVSRDNAKAAEWFRLAAKQQAAGQAIAYQAKGIVPEDLDGKIVWWLERSAELGQSSARYLLAQVYLQLGKPLQAMQWALIARHDGQPGAVTLLAEARQQSNVVEQQQASQQAQEWLKSHP